MPRSLPPLTAIKAFEAAGRLGSLTLAAKELGVSQVAVSRKVRELELYLDVALFTRHHRRVEITRKGKQLLSGLTRAFDDMDRAVRQQQKFKSQGSAQRFLSTHAAPSNAGSKHLAWLMASFA